MKKRYILTMLCIAMGLFAMAQNPAMRNQRFLTDYEKGKTLETDVATTSFTCPIKTEPEAKGAVLNWQATDAQSIAQYVKVSGQTQKGACGWGLNQQRLSVYNNVNSTPLWQFYCQISSWDEVIDMTDDGAFIVNGFDSAVQVFTPASEVPIWTVATENCVRAVNITNDGQKIFVATFNYSTQTDSYLTCYQVGQATPLWSKAFVGNFTAMNASKSGNRVVFCEYGGAVSKLYILDGDNGNQLFEAPFQNQNPPGISYDGKYVVSGDYSGFIFLYEYDETRGTYAEKWHYRVNGSSAWVWGMNISADGSTIAVGTLVFLSADYDGELYLFNTYSPVPVWIATGFKDAVVSTDLSEDGSLIAAGTWGPLDNTRPDMMLYRKQSNTPYFSINSPGSIFSVDLSANGKLCMAGGKAVHARALGMGGKLYNITSDPGGGILSGFAIKQGSSQLAGVKIELLGINNYFTYTNDQGTYSLPYIPAGTYMARYSAVGYVPQETSVVITDAQTTVQDVTLVSTGDPPLNLFATMGAGLTVDLSWQPPVTGTVLGYKIYRKLYGPDFYPETPLATVGPTQLDYSDNAVLPITHYFYAVTAILAGDLQSPYSNDAEGWICTGYIAPELSSYMGTTPVINGIISPGEWDDAYEVDISDFLGTRDNLPNPIGSVMAYLKVNQAKTALFCAVENFNDNVLEDHDEVAFYVDDNHDGVFPPTGDDSEGNYWAVHYATGDLIRYRPLYNNGGVGTTVEIPNAQIAVSAATGHVVYEFVIPLGPGENWNINFNEESQSGIFSFVLDDPSNFDGYWPYYTLNIFNPAQYGVITFGDEDLVPPPPDNLNLSNTPPSLNIRLDWDQPEINDFDSFNLYMSHNGEPFSHIVSTIIGVEFFYILPNNDEYRFYLTTVDKGGHESEPSQIVSIGGGGTTFSLSGYIRYPNNALDPLGGVSVVLRNSSGTVVGTTLTNIQGYYSFTGLNNGNYTLEPSTAKAWGGVTALDVLLYKKHIANIAFLQGIFLASGDVNASGGLTAADVLLVKKRIAYVINSFVVGDWLFNNLPITINGANVNQDFNGLCYGDANGSYTPPGGARPEQQPEKALSGMITIGKATEQDGKVTVPVFARDISNLGSFQFSMAYDQGNMTFAGTSNWYQGIDNVVTGNPLPGRITFVWAADERGITIGDQKLFELQFVTRTQAPAIVAWSDVPVPREFSDYDGNIFIPAFRNGSTGQVTGPADLRGNNLLVYPNPSKDVIAVVSESVITSVTVYSPTGQMVIRQMAGDRQVTVSVSGLSRGLYHVRAETSSGTFDRNIVIE